MNLLKKLGLFLTAVLFFTSLSVVSANAQPGKNRWKGNNGNHYGWYKNRQNSGRNWRNDYYRQNRRYYGSYGRITPQEYWRLQRQRNRLYRSYNRSTRDGYLTDRERRRLSRQYYKYRRSVYRDRRDW